MHRAAGQVRCIRSRIAIVLDPSHETVAFGVDASAVVGIYAGAIGSRLLVGQAP